MSGPHCHLFCLARCCIPIPSIHPRHRPACARSPAAACFSGLPRPLHPPCVSPEHLFTARPPTPPCTVALRAPKSSARPILISLKTHKPLVLASHKPLVATQPSFALILAAIERPYLSHRIQPVPVKFSPSQLPLIHPSTRRCAALDSSRA